MEALSDWYVKTIVLDFPTHVKIVNCSDLECWGITFEELFSLGLERLKNSSPARFRSENGYFVGTWSDDYDSSRMLLPGIFEDLPIEGEPVLCSPNRQTLIVADSKNLMAVAAMLVKAEEIVRTIPRPMNLAPLTYEGGKLVDYVVPKDSPIFDQVRRAKGLAGSFYYSQQKQLLTELHKKTGKDHFIAAYNVYERKEGGHMCYSVWSKGIQTLLPKTDLVVFFDPEKPETDRMVGTLPWEKVQASFGQLMLDTNLFPPRFYVSEFPSEEELVRMKSSSAADPDHC
jgi:hypothetical protein